MMMNLAAFTAGVDRPLGTPDETDRLYAYLMIFIEGATLAHSTGELVGILIHPFVRGRDANPFQHLDCASLRDLLRDIVVDAVGLCDL